MRRDESLDQLAESVIGAFFDVYNRLKPGWLEQVYVGALCVEFRLAGISYQREHPIEVLYRGEAVGFYRADLLVAARLIVEVKAGRVFDESARWQTLNYLRGTGMPLGLVLHFGRQPRFHRVVGPSHRLWREG